MARDELDTWVLVQLAGRRAWIERSTFEQMPDLTMLGQQLIHGDYQESNLFFADGQVVAMIDWDQTYVASREWEIVRSLHYTCAFDSDYCRAFLDGYRARTPLDLDALDLAAQCYALMRAHDLWHYQAIYFEGNRRIRKFISPGPFVSLAEQWAALNEQLRIEN
jgi:homoserine kinase type II